MNVADGWGRDPSVQVMRRVFRRMETAQDELLDSLTIPRFDLRLRGWREMARLLFDRSWAQAAKQGIEVSEEEAAALYVLCLAEVMRMECIEIPAEMLPGDEQMKLILKGVLA